jgi:uncharacterized membrane protein YczE
MARNRLCHILIATLSDSDFSFLNIRAVPHLFWSAPHPFTIRPPLISVVLLVVGLVIFGIGEALMIASSVGVSPWTVLAQGITNITGWSVGLATFVVSFIVLLVWVPLRQTPGIGTVLNIIIISVVLDLALPFLPQFESLTLRVAEAAVGVIVTGIGGGIYLIANLGPGPRDGLMTGLQRLTGFPIAGVRSAIEISAVLLGWLLGGVVGVGTMLYAFGIGPCVAASMYMLLKAFGDELPERN